eukprot:TCONS_00030958-protein
MSRGRSVHYKSLNDFSSELFSEHEVLALQKVCRRRRDVYNAEEILAEKKIGKKTHYLVKWERYSTSDCTWEPAENLLDRRLLQFWEQPCPGFRQVEFHVERLLSCFDASLKERLKSVKQLDFPVAIFRYLFHGRGLDKKSGSKQLYKHDCQSFPMIGTKASLIREEAGEKLPFQSPFGVSYLNLQNYSRPQIAERFKKKKHRLVQRLSVLVFKDTFNS